MRSILDRYIFSELLPPFLISLGALCFVLLTNELLRLVELLVSHGIGLLSLFKVVLYLMPSFLVLSLPIAGIIASVTAFSRMSYDRELLAMRGAGLSVLRLARPVLVFSCLVFGLTFALSQWGQPWSNFSLKALALSLLRDNLTLALDQGVFNEPVPKLVVYVADRQHGGGRARGIFISDERNPSEPKLIVASGYRVLHDSGQNGVLLRLLNGSIHSQSPGRDRDEQGAFSRYDLPLPLDRNLYRPVRERPTREVLLQRLEETNWKDSWARRRLTESYKDLAFPVAALLLGPLGVPVGIVSRRTGRIGGFAVGITVVILYYMLNVLCDFLVVTLVLPPFAGAWLPNGMFLGVVIVLFGRLRRQ